MSILQVQDPVDTVDRALRDAMDTLGVADVVLFMTTIKTMGGAWFLAYHDAGAPYGLGNGNGALQWVCEQINRMQYEAQQMGEAGDPFYYAVA